MKKVMLFPLVIIMAFNFGYAQQSVNQVVETTNLLPKKGMNSQFEAAITAHNEKFHPEGPYVAGLRRIDYGKKAGWYVWLMGPTSYSALDSRPTDQKGHMDDWNKNVDPLVQKYGEVGLSELNADLSHGMDNFSKTSKYEVWFVDLKRGQYYRFKALAEKLKKTYASMENISFLVFNNQVHTAGGPDVGLVWGFSTYQEWSTNSGARAAFEKIYGENSWQRMLDEWNDIVVDYNAELRTKI
jgi:hypothetical protein